MVMRLGPGPEFDLIRAFLTRAGTDTSCGEGSEEGSDGRIRIGPGDDCAVVVGDGVAVTVDMVIEGIHFRRDWLEPHEVGYRATAAAISDLAAMAARPIGVLASLALGPGDEESFGLAVMEGVAASAAAVGAVVLGGDLTRSPGPVALDVVALGEAPRPVLRGGAHPGDEVWVTGELGGAAAAVAAWEEGREPEATARSAYARPTPRIREALWLLERGVPTAMIDLSDGIAGDAGHIAAASGVAVRVRAGDLPVAPSAHGDIRLAVAGGEDYELCFTARAGAVEPLRDAFRAEHGVDLTRVGSVEAGSGAVVVDDRGKSVGLSGFQHWGSR